MQKEILNSVLQSFDYRFQSGKSEGLKMIENYAKSNNLSIDKYRLTLEQKINDTEFDWVEAAIRNHFIYTHIDLPPKPLDVDELMIFTDSFQWKDIVQPDALLSKTQREELKEQFREIGVQYYDDIFELLAIEDFKWLPFEVKHAYKTGFSKMSYTNDDIIYHLKRLVWDYFFPNSHDENRLISLKNDLIKLLRESKGDQGWSSLSKIVNVLEPNYPNLDLYEISLIDWDQTLNRKNHYRNPFTLGFARICQK